MEITTTLLIVLLLTSIISSTLSVVAKLIYDGIKAKNGNGKANGSNRISTDFALLTKDIDFNNKKLAEIERGIDRLIELTIASKEQSNVHLIDLKTAVTDQTNSFRALIQSMTAAMAKLENKLESKL